MPNLADIDNPYEDQEQEAFVKWLDDNGYPRFRVPNERRNGQESSVELRI